jgi:hypothetical protein
VYWEGKRTALVDLCIESIQRHFPDVCVLGPEEFDRLWIVDRMDFSHLPPNARGDWVRYYLLYHFGGVWVDADTLVLRDCQEVVDQLDEYDQVGYKTLHRGWRMCGLLGCHAGDPVMGKWYENAWDIITNEETSWATHKLRGQIGPRMLRRFSPEDEGLRVKLWPQHYWLQDRSGWEGKDVTPHTMNKVGSDMRWVHTFCTDSYAYHVGHAVMRWAGKLPRHRLLTMNRALGYLIRRSRQADYYRRTYEHLYDNLGYHRQFIYQSHLDKVMLPWMRENIWDQFQSVLDIGTSYGWSVHAMASEGKDAVGVDIATKAVTKAVEMGRNVVHGSALALPFEDKSFDAVTSSDVFEHLLPEDAERAVKEAIRVCRQWICMRICNRPSAYPTANRIFGNIHPTVKPIDWWIDRFREASGGTPGVRGSQGR